MKKLLILLVVALVAYGVYDVVRQVRGAYTTDYSRTYSHAVDMVMCREFDSLHLSGRGIRIGVLDAGFGGFRENRWTKNLEVAAWRDFTGGDDAAFFDDQQVHGTQVCANIGGFSGDTIMGLACNAVYFLAKTDRPEIEPRCEEEQMIRGIEWLLAQDVNVINSSLAYTKFDDFKDYTPQMLDGCSSVLSGYLDSLLTARPELVFVQCAGNEGDKSWRYIAFPADVPGVITVGASSFDGVARGHSSGVGCQDVDFIKPDFVVADSPIGTSFSTPVIAGLCACLLEYRHLEREALVALLHASGTNAEAPDHQIGYGAPQTEWILKELGNNHQ